MRQLHASRSFSLEAILSSLRGLDTLTISSPSLKPVLRIACCICRRRAFCSVRSASPESLAKGLCDRRSEPRWRCLTLQTRA